MGKRLKSQRRGRGGQTFLSTKKAKAKVSYPDFNKNPNQNIKGQIVDLIHDPVRSAILADVLFEDGSNSHIIAAEGISIGQNIEFGRGSEIKVGNIMPLNDIPEGCPIFSVERKVGDGGTLIRSSGIYGLIVTKDSKNAYVKLSSGRLVPVDLRARATIGNVSCSGRTEKPFVKAGNKFFAMKAKNKPYPTVRGVAMNALDHPFGGSQHHAGKSKSTSRHSPPGRKVGAIASKRTGRKKK